MTSKNRQRKNNQMPSQLHDQHLDQLVYRLNEVDENPKKIEWILKDGVWMPDDNVRRYKLCDLVCVYYDKHVTAIELKGSRKSRRKAREQCESGAKFAREVLGLNDICKKAVYYKPAGRYTYEVFK